MAILGRAAKNSLRGTIPLPHTYPPCAVDAAIWTEQQLVAIPGWLCEDQNARLRRDNLHQ
jgi:hypothetical protein